MSSVQSRFENFVNRLASGCWQWMGAKSPKGYGRFHWDGNKHAHPVAYEIFKGAIPGGLVLDHLCRNPSCVNPDHLEPVTHVENIRRGDHFAKGWKRDVTHCPQGHEYTDDNTYIVRRLTRNSTARMCRECIKNQRLKRKGAAA